MNIKKSLLVAVNVVSAVVILYVYYRLIEQHMLFQHFLVGCFAAWCLFVKIYDHGWTINGINEDFYHGELYNFDRVVINFFICIFLFIYLILSGILVK